jgi:hypothetical protein
MADVQKKLQALSDSYQGLQAGKPPPKPEECYLISE